jgi:hypothetical protein
MRVTKRQTNTLASKRDSIRHHLGTLLFQESHSRASPRPRQSRRQRSPTKEDLACEICQSLAHITTECPTTPNLVYDQADTLPGRYDLTRASPYQPPGWHSIKPPFITWSRVSFDIFGSCTTVDRKGLIYYKPSTISWTSPHCQCRNKKYRHNRGIQTGTFPFSITRSTTW